MATLATGQPPPGVVQPPSNPSNTSPPLNLSQTNPQTQNPSYKSILHPKPITTEIRSIPAPTFELHHGEPSFVWEDLDVNTMVINEDLQFAVVGKFAYGMPEFHELKKQLPLQLEIKGECCIGFLESRHVLIRLSLLEDYVHLLSRPAFYIKIGHRLHQMRGLKYEVWFDPKEETSIGVAWISFPGLPPVFFGKESLFSLARAVGRPLQLDAATLSKSRPSCAKVKVEVDLVAHRPQRIRIGIKNSTNGEIKYKWIRVMYDHIPKYCKECKLQGHDEVECYVLHPELIPQEEQVTEPTNAAKDMDKNAPLRVLTSGKTVGMAAKGEEAVLATQGQGRQGKSFKKFIPPNRNPNAWVIVENKSKKVQSDDARDQREKVVTNNAFDLLDNIDEIQAEKGLEHDVVHDVNVGQKEKVFEGELRAAFVTARAPVATINEAVRLVNATGGDKPSPLPKQLHAHAHFNDPTLINYSNEESRGECRDVVHEVASALVDKCSPSLVVNDLNIGESRGECRKNEASVGNVGDRGGIFEHHVQGSDLKLKGVLVEHETLESLLMGKGNHAEALFKCNDINAWESRGDEVLKLGEIVGQHSSTAFNDTLSRQRESAPTGVKKDAACLENNVLHAGSELIIKGVQLGSSCGSGELGGDQQPSALNIANGKFQKSCAGGIIIGEHVLICADSRVGGKELDSRGNVMESSRTRNDEHSKIPSQNPCGIKTMSDLFVGELSPTGFCADSRVNENVDLRDVSALRHSRGSIVQPSILNPSIMGNSAHGTNLMQDIYASNVSHGSHSKAEINKHAAASQSTRRDVLQVCEAGGRGALKTRGAHSQSARRVDKRGDFDPLLHQLSPKLSGNKLKEPVGFQVFNEDGKASLTTAVGLPPLNNDDLIPLPKLKLMTAQVNAACLMSGINAPLNTSVRRAPVAAVSALPVIENTSQQEVPSNSMEIKITSDAAIDGNGQELPDPEDDEELLDYGEDDETDAASTENYEEDPADEYIGLRGLLSTDSSVKGDEFDNAQEAASPKNAVIEKQQGSPEKAQVGAEMPLVVGDASPGLSEGRLSEKELLRAAFYSSRSNNSQLVAKNFEPKPNLAHLVDKLPAQEVNIGEDDELDTESTAQNYVNAAANADLSPEKVAEHKKKLKKYRGRRDKSVPPTVGGRRSARITLSKTSGRQ